MAEEDAELKDLVIQSLENNGVLAKIKAQLRASVFLALDEVNTLEKKKPLVNHELQNYLATKQGQIGVSLVREFLQHFNLDSTLSVFESESCYEQLYSDKDGQSLCRDLGLNQIETSKGPIVDAIIRKQLLLSDATDSNPITNNESIPTKPNSLNVTPSSTAAFSREAEECERDPFFDDPNPEEVNSGLENSLEIGGYFGNQDSDTKSAAVEEKQTLPLTGGFQDSTFMISSLGSLKDLPPMGSLRDAPLLASLRDAPPLADVKGTNKPLLWNDDKPSTFKTASAQEDDYEEDFQSSASVRSDMKTGTEHSIEEDIEENFSGIVDDLLSNEGISEADDATTDHTISNMSAVGADYLESMN